MAFQEAESLKPDSWPARCWPVGSIFISVVDTDPADLLGFGTWQAVGGGRVLTGLDVGQPEFNTLGMTGGAKEVTLTAGQSGLPAHTHVQDPHTHVQNAHAHTAIVASNTAATSGSNPARGTGTQGAVATTNATAVNQNATAVNQNAGPAGAAQAHPNLPPYLVVRFWQRTA